jgi:hypothetical protein
MTTRIAMWSGPRNISTAMMRSWENRKDCSVIDEPFYAYYLQQTQSPHPMYKEILNAQSSDFMQVAKQMSEGACDTELQYQKHMTHHMLSGCDMSWTSELLHCFLIRDPAHVVNSYTNSRGQCSAQDIGIQRQYELYQEISRISGQPIAVVDSLSVLQNPIQQIEKICQALHVDFDLAMLNWPSGKRSSDGVWASHWYHSVEKSTGFGLPNAPTLELSPQQLEVVEEVTPYYRALKALAI